MNKAFKREYTSSADFVFEGNSQQNFKKQHFTVRT